MDKTITFTMEDALLSPISMAILTKARYKKMAGTDPIHATTKIAGKKGKAYTHAQDEEEPALGDNLDDWLYDNNNSTNGPQITIRAGIVGNAGSETGVDKGSFVGLSKYALVPDDTKTGYYTDISAPVYVQLLKDTEKDDTAKAILVKEVKFTANTGGAGTGIITLILDGKLEGTDGTFSKPEDSVLFFDFYKTKTHTDEELVMTIEPESFEGNYYLEASTLFRNKSGLDMPAEFIIPNCKPQSAMTFSMSGTGDPSTFTFTLDAFPGYTTFDPGKKVLAAIQIMSATEADLGTAFDGLTQF